MLNPKQFLQPQPSSESLPMFMTGSEIKRKATGSIDVELNDWWFDDPGGAMNSMWQGKLAESKEFTGTSGETLYSNIERTGQVNRPVRLVRNALDSGWVHGDGHHRTAAAADVSRRGKQIYVPVTYDETSVFDDAPLKEDLNY